MKPRVVHALAETGRAYCGVAVGPGLEPEYVARRDFFGPRPGSSSGVHKDERCHRCERVMKSIHAEGLGELTMCNLVRHGDIFCTITSKSGFRQIMHLGEACPICVDSMERYDSPEHDEDFNDDEEDEDA